MMIPPMQSRFISCIGGILSIVCLYGLPVLSSLAADCRDIAEESDSSQLVQIVLHHAVVDDAETDQTEFELLFHDKILLYSREFDCGFRAV